MNNKNVEKNYIYNLVYQMLVVIVPFITTPYISRVLHAEGVGAFSFTMAVVEYFALFGNLGVAIYGQLKIAGLRDNKHEISKVFCELFLLRIILMLNVLFIYIGFIHIMGQSSFQKLYYVLIVQFASGMFDISWFFAGIEEFKKIVARNIIIKLLSVILIFCFVKTSSDLILYAVIMSGSAFLGNISIYLFLPQYIERIALKELRIFTHLRASLTYFIPTIATAIYLSLDKTMIGWFTKTSVENGYYEQAHKIEQMAVTVFTSLSTVTMPRMAYLYMNQEIKQMKQRLKQTVNYVLFLSIPMCLGIMAVSDYFIPLYLGGGFEKSIKLLRIFSVLLVIVGLNNVIGKQVLMAIGRQSQYNVSVIVGAVLNFMLNFMLIPQMLSVGAAIASVIAETVILFIFLYYSKDYIKLSWIFKNSVKYFIAGIIMFGVICFSYKIFEMNWLNFIIQIVIGIVVYIAILILLRDKFVLYTLTKLKTSFTKKKLS